MVAPGCQPAVPESRHLCRGCRKQTSQETPRRLTLRARSKWELQQKLQSRRPGRKFRLPGTREEGGKLRIMSVTERSSNHPVTPNSTGKKKKKTLPPHSQAFLPDSHEDLNNSLYCLKKKEKLHDLSVLLCMLFSLEGINRISCVMKYILLKFCIHDCESADKTTQIH